MEILNGDRLEILRGSVLKGEKGISRQSRKTYLYITLYGNEF
jgi:hypothetical protein